nr:MAG TPA: hypothetical protein [Caudoviricetes sp.]
MFSVKLYFYSRSFVIRQNHFIHVAMLILEFSSSDPKPTSSHIKWESY